MENMTFGDLFGENLLEELKNSTFFFYLFFLTNIDSDSCWWMVVKI